MPANKRDPHFATNLIHSVNLPDRSAVPIDTANTTRGEYTRDRNATLDILRDALVTLDGGAGGVVTASGMAAATITLLTCLKAGDRIIRHHCTYCSVAEFFEQVICKFGVEVVTIDLRDMDALDAALADGAAIVYGETISNPNLEVTDVAAVAERAHKAGALLVLDNTFASSYYCRPLELGADVAVYSATKYFSGHGDAIGGMIVANDEELTQRLWHMMTIHGGSMSPFNASLILRGLKTLAVRMDAHSAGAAKLAAFLKTHPKVTYVRYPGLIDDSEHAIAVKQMSGFSGMLAFGIDADQETSERFLTKLKLCKAAPSLGDVETLVGVTRVWEPARIMGSYARVSVGLEDIADVIADIDQALRAI